MSSVSNRLPVSKACSLRIRWQKPCMVKMGTLSKLFSAACISWVAGVGLACESPIRAAFVSTSFLRIRSLSSSVAAFVKVTTRICSADSRFSMISLRNSSAMVKVLPVPALASMRLVPTRGASGKLNGFIALNLSTWRIRVNSRSEITTHVVRLKLFRLKAEGVTKARLPYFDGNIWFLHQPWL